jgi:hypothetical protein
VPVGAGAAAALWLIVKLVLPAMVSVALRAAPAFDATVKATVPLPLPDAPDEIATKVALLVAVQAHPAAAVTGTDPDPPAAPNAEAVMTPAETVHDGVVVLLLLLLEHATDSKRTVAGRRRRFENGMYADCLPLALSDGPIGGRGPSHLVSRLGRDYTAIRVRVGGSCK